MTSSSRSPQGADDGWDASALAQLRDNLRLTPAERLAIAEALLTFALRTPHYTPKLPLREAGTAPRDSA